LIKTNDELLAEIKELLEKKCKESDISLTELSIKLGKNKRFISNKFSKNSTITVNILFEVAAILNCEPSIFIPSIKKNK
jgi:transcriptional regulator with XRE-family HTH domain